MLTEIRERMENSGEEIFHAFQNRDGTRLISKLYNDRGRLRILSEDLEYKNCLLDLTLTGKL